MGTHYNINPTSTVCTGTCANALAHYAGIGKPAGKCPDCGGELRQVQGEPYGTPHPQRTTRIGGPS